MPDHALPEGPDLRPDLLDAVQRILQTHAPQHEVWAFGSRVKGVVKPYSDLDLAIITQQPLALGVLGPLQDAFAESDLPWRVDVVDWACTSPAFRDIIQQTKVVQCEAHKWLKINSCQRFMGR